MAAPPLWESHGCSCRGGGEPGRAASVSPSQQHHSCLVLTSGLASLNQGLSDRKTPNFSSRDLRNYVPRPGAFKILSNLQLKINSLPNLGDCGGDREDGGEGWVEGPSQGDISRKPGVPSDTLGFRCSNGFISSSLSETFLRKLVILVIGKRLLLGTQKSVNCHRFIIKSFGSNSLGCKLWRQMGSPIGIWRGHL